MAIQARSFLAEYTQCSDSRRYKVLRARASAFAMLRRTNARWLARRSLGVGGSRAGHTENGEKQGISCTAGLLSMTRAGPRRVASRERPMLQKPYASAGVSVLSLSLRSAMRADLPRRPRR